jgi:hypothetical protein
MIVNVESLHAVSVVFDRESGKDVGPVAFAGERRPTCETTWFMNSSTVDGPAMRRVSDFREELRNLTSESLDVVMLEERVQDLLRELGRELMAEVLQRADTDAPEVHIDGVHWGNQRRSRATYVTLFGEIRVERSTYQRLGRGRLAVPMELRLGIVEGRYTPKVSRVLSRAIALMPAEDAEGFLAEVGVAKVSVSTLHRIPRNMAARYEEHSVVIEATVRQQDRVPEGAATAQVALDGVMVPQDGEHARARGRKTDEPSPSRHESRYGPTRAHYPAANDNKSGRAWHEASVGTVSFWDAKGMHLRTVYIAEMPEERKYALVTRLEKELHAALEERPDLNVVFASDGALTHWDALHAMERRLPATATGHRMLLVDLFHLGAYLSSAANVAEGDGTPEAKILATFWRETLKTFDDGTRRVLKMMRYRRDQQTTDAGRDAIQADIDFIANQAENGRTNYADAIARNYPVGTGVTEAAAKTLVNVRMKRAGSRFDQHGGQTVLLFRAALLSQRFSSLSEQLELTYRARVEAA